MKVLQFDDYADLAFFMMEMATEENKCVYAVLFYEDARKLLKELMLYEDTIIENIDLTSPMCTGYKKEFYVVLDDGLHVSVDEAWHEANEYSNEGYFNFGDDSIVALYSGDANYKTIHAGEGSFQFEIEIFETSDDEFDVDEEDFEDFLEYMFRKIFEE